MDGDAEPLSVTWLHHVLGKSRLPSDTMRAPRSKIQVQGKVLLDLRLGRKDGTSRHSGRSHFIVRLWWSDCAMSWSKLAISNACISFFMSFDQLITFNNRICNRISCFNDGTYGRP
jgi:hypothetical protein